MPTWVFLQIKPRALLECLFSTDLTRLSNFPNTCGKPAATPGDAEAVGAADLPHEQQRPKPDTFLEVQLHSASIPATQDGSNAGGSFPK